MQSRFKSLVSALALIALTGAVIPDAPIDGNLSSVTAEFRQADIPVDARFGKFTGSVHYDPKIPAAARAHIEIDMSSLDIGSEEYNTAIRKPEWFDSAQYPVAIFQARSVRPTGTNRFQAAGELALKGKTQSVLVSITLASAGGLDSFDGSVPVSRSKFGIGGPNWDAAVADEVLIKFHIVTPAVR